MELIKILKNLDKKFPEKLAAPWDKSGLQNFNGKNQLDLSKNIFRILVCLDITKEVVERALAEKVDLIISRHPFIFEELALVKRNPAKKIMLQNLIENKIFLLAIHSNYDYSSNNFLQTFLESEFAPKKIKRCGAGKEGFHVLLKDQLSLDQLQQKFSHFFVNADNMTNLRWNPKTLIKDFYIASGAAGDFMITERLTNATFITGEVKWHQWIYANDNSNNLLSLGHYMENYFTRHLTEILQNAWPDLKIIAMDIQKQYQK